jgi:hypothetical protein
MAAVFQLLTYIADWLPRVKAINYFNSNNLLLSHRQNNNYTVTNDPKVLSAYRSAIAHPYYLPAPIGASGLQPVQIPSIDDLAKKLGLKPLDDGDTVTGKAMLSAWITSTGPKPIVRFLIDGKVVSVANRGDFWETELNPSSLGTGDRRIRVEAFDSRGRMVASRTALITLAAN